MRKTVTTPFTAEQAQSYQSAVSYILQYEGDETQSNLYRIQYKNCGVTYSDGVLDTQYNGMAIRFDWSDDAFFPPLDLTGSNEGVLNYIGDVTAYNNDFTGAYTYLLQVENGSAVPTLKAMKPKAEGTVEDLLGGKYDTLPDLSACNNLICSGGSYYEIAYEGEAVLPVASWTKTERLLAYFHTLSDEPTMAYVPLSGGQYFILYEITDASGNIYCSPLIPYEG